MSISARQPISADLLQKGLRVSALSIAWTVVASTISVVLGLMNDSLVLIAFGFTGLFDAAGSIALVVHFRHGIKHDTFSDAHERVALIVVTVGLIVVALATAAGSIHRLVWGGESGESRVGLAVACASIVALGILSAVKRSTGAAIPSNALHADGLLSLVGALLAAVTVAGSVATHRGINWADPVAALFIAAGALTTVVLIHRGE